MNRSNDLELSALTGSRISRRTVLSAVLLTPAVAAVLAACGDSTKVKDSSASSTASTAGTSTSTGGSTATTTAQTTADTTAPTDTSGPTGTAVSVTGLEHPTGADEVILRYGYVGGFVQQGYAFRNVPNVLITGDGRLIQQGVTTLQFPGSLLPALQERTITEEGIQLILATADAAGLLAPPPDYSIELLVADAADTRVELNAKGGSFVHQAPALGFQDPAETKVRITLHDFTIALDDIEHLVGAKNLGEAAPFVAESYRFQARPLTVEDLAGYTDPKPTQVPWPSDVGVTLAGAADCAVVDAAKVGSLFADANELTFFVEEDTTYMVAAVALLPGDSCPAAPSD